MIRTLAWSRLGAIAHISNDGRKVTFRTVARSQTTGVWSLSKPIPDPSLAVEDVRFQHLEWSRHGTELAVVDQYGRIHLFKLVFAFGRMTPMPIRPSGQHDDLTSIVGMHWLPLFPNDSRVGTSRATKNLALKPYRRQYCLQLPATETLGTPSLVRLFTRANSSIIPYRTCPLSSPFHETTY